jgi:hypothetical protein
MIPESSQQSATGPYSEPQEFNPHLHVLLFKVHFNIIFPATPAFIPSRQFLLGFPATVLYITYV